jgi:hypothetical protein
LGCTLQIDADSDPVPDPPFHFYVDPDADPDPYFYVMRMRIQVTKMLGIRIHNIAWQATRKIENNFFYCEDLG